jgi:hypothetical protein
MRDPGFNPPRDPKKLAIRIMVRLIKGMVYPESRPDEQSAGSKAESAYRFPPFSGFSVSTRVRHGFIPEPEFQNHFF